MKQDDTKKKILDCALELFSSRGYDSVSVGEIAKAVGIKAPSLYNHYSGKQAIFDAIVEDTAVQYEKYTNEIDIHLQNAKKDTDVFSGITEDLLAKKVRQIFCFSLRNKAVSRFRRMMTIEQFRCPNLSELYSARYVEQLVTYHSEIFKSLIASGALKAENPDSLALMYVAPLSRCLAFATASRSVRRNASKSWTHMCACFSAPFTFRKISANNWRRN